MRQLQNRYLTSKVSLLGFTCLCLQLATHTEGYSQVQISGGGSANNEGPKIFKALNMDLIYPRTFNSSLNVISTTETTMKAPAPSEPNMRQLLQQQQQQHKYSNTHEAQLLAAEQPILFVTPATDNDSQLPTHHATATINPALAVVNEQQDASHQSDAYETPTDASLLAVLSPPLQEDASTGRAVDYNRPAYNFNQIMTPLYKSPTLRVPTQQSPNIAQIIYPHEYSQRPPPNRAEINKLAGTAQFSDRFTPGEATAAGQFAKHRNHANKVSNSGNKIAAASQVVEQTYKPPQNIYSFPPNINSQYTSPYQDPKAALPSNNVNSYVPPPSGPLVAAASTNDSGYKYPGPGDDTKKPISSTTDDQKDMEGGSDTDIDNGSSDTIGVLPASAMGDAEKDMNGKESENNAGGDDAGTMNDDHGHDHPPPDDDTEYPTPPPGWVEQHPDAVHDSSHIPHAPNAFHDLHNDHHIDFHDHYPPYPKYFHSYPEIIWDGHHHHHDHPPPPPPPTLPPITTEMPPPEPPPEPRVKKYSYFYIGRKLWYIPLYFTVWFSFYVLWLILKSIARHKVNLPNHYVSRRSVHDFIPTEAKANEYINDLTVAVLEKIEKFQRNYVT